MADVPKPYRLLPKPIEASTWSNRAISPVRSAAACKPPTSGIDGQPGSEQCDARTVDAAKGSFRRPHPPSIPPRKARFAPELVQVFDNIGSNEARQQERKPPRRFVPQLIETSSRTRKAADAAVRLGHQDRTDAVTEQEAQNASAALRSQRCINPGQRRRTRSGAHLHSFRMPDLETIVSSESEGSGSSASSAVPHKTPRDHFTADLHGELDRYMLELEARRVQSKLQEQALAAFANSDYHEPIEHYVNLDDDAYDDRPTTWDGHEAELIASTEPFRREDTLKVNWDLLEMRQYHETLEQERNFMRTTAKRQSPGPSRSPFWRSRHTSASSQSDLTRMRNGARPPMLGQDIVFPRSDSPEPARFDVSQGSHLLKSSTCYLTEQLEASARLLISPDGLWGGLAAPLRAKSSQSGLWGGLCAGDEAPPNTGVTTPSGHEQALPSSKDYSIDIRTELPTPVDDVSGDPFNRDNARLAVPAKMRRLASAPDRIQLASPPLSQSESSVTDDLADFESELDTLIETEFPDSFVTQVFNYLSLGYPSLARSFDSELSKVTLIPVSELRSDDEMAASMARGYIRLGSDFEGEGEGPTNSDFSRWRALKLYIHDWVRADLERKGLESTRGVGDGHSSHNSELLGVAGEHFGTAPRRGSWAW